MISNGKTSRNKTTANINCCNILNLLTKLLIDNTAHVPYNQIKKRMTLHLHINDVITHDTRSRRRIDRTSEPIGLAYTFERSTTRIPQGTTHDAQGSMNRTNVPVLRRHRVRGDRA